MQITLDDKKIFEGEIARASGGILGNTDTFGDVSHFILLNMLIYNTYVYM